MGKKPTRKSAAPKRPPHDLLATGVPGLDEVLGGGLPALSFNLIAGGPGAGKTTLAMQLIFAQATAEKPALFCTMLGEPSLKMLRYQQQFEFFDQGRVGSHVHFMNLNEEALAGDLDGVLARITEEVGRTHAGLVVVDSFRSIVRTHVSEAPDLSLEHFVQKLALHLTSWEITSFLIGEYEGQELRNPVFTVADGILWLTQAVERNSVVRKLQVVKLRGVASMPGLHTVRISSQGMQVFPRTPEYPANVRKVSDKRLSTGMEALDEMMGGGITEGDSLVLSGPTGTGKTSFALQFAGAGLREGEAVVIAVFEEKPELYLERARSFGVDFREAVRKGKLRIIYLRPLDLSVDETLAEIRMAVEEMGATRVVIDSISGFEMALAPTFRQDFRESLYRLIGALAALGVTIYSTVEVLDSRDTLVITGYQISFLTDVIIAQRYVEIEGELRKALAVVKMRGSNHSLEFRAYDITASGVELRESLREFDGITSGVPTRQPRAPEPEHPALTEEERQVLEFIIRAGSATVTEIAKRVGLKPRAMAGVLDRLVDLEYVVPDGKRFTGVSRRRHTEMSSHASA